jgi:exodeoxyribonuclease VII small subunit
MPKSPSSVVGTAPASPAKPVDPTSTSASAAVPAVPSADVTPPASYEAGLQELERLVNELESGQLPLDRLLVSYQRGAFLLSHCRDRLQAVEDQIKVLDAGTLKPWSAE